MLREAGFLPGFTSPPRGARGSWQTFPHGAVLSGEGQCGQHVADSLLQPALVSEVQGGASASALCSKILSVVSCS